MLNYSQRKILLTIARGAKKGFTGKDFIKSLDMTGAAITKSLKLLLQLDYVEKMENGEHRIVDPLMATALKVYFDDENTLQ